jgi:hypothetical protein
MIKYTVEVYESGYKSWRLKDKLHREDGPAVEFVDGSKSWWLNGKKHREDGPAIEYADGNKYWYLNGELHREDGPAVEYANGDKHWYLNGRYLTEEEHKKAMNPPKPSCEGKEVEIDGIVYVLKEKNND